MRRRKIQNKDADGKEDYYQQRRKREKTKNERKIEGEGKVCEDKGRRREMRRGKKMVSRREEEERDEERKDVH